MSCHGLNRAFQHYEVNIGWYPYRATQTTHVHSKPGCGLILAEVREHAGVALQSVRNPRASDRPPLRPPTRGVDGELYVWGYRREGAITGWIRQHDLERDPDAAQKPPCDGPASMDFEVGRQHCQPGAHNGCGTLSTTRPLMTVTATTAHLRYSAHGTSYHILHKGDKGRVLIANAPQGNHFLEITHATADGSARARMRGYVSTTALKRL